MPEVMVVAEVLEVPEVTVVSIVLKCQMWYKHPPGGVHQGAPEVRPPHRGEEEEEGVVDLPGAPHHLLALPHRLLPLPGLQPLLPGEGGPHLLPLPPGGGGGGQGQEVEPGEEQAQLLYLLLLLLLPFNLKQF